MMLPFRTDEEITAAIPQIGRHLRAGKLLAYPTETVYGLGSAPSVPALGLLANLKGRPEGKPFLLLISGRRMAEEWGLVFSASASTRRMCSRSPRGSASSASRSRDSTPLSAVTKRSFRGRARPADGGEGERRSAQRRARC